MIIEGAVFGRLILDGRRGVLSVDKKKKSVDSLVGVKIRFVKMQRVKPNKR